MIDLIRFPIGEHHFQPFSEALKEQHLLAIESLPTEAEYAILNLDEAQLHIPYRDKGWTINQVIHHISDSHLNSYIRFKLGLTENNPTIKPYDEKLWAELADSKIVPVNISITLLHALHIRWVALMRNFEEGDWKKTIYHPGSNKEMSLWYLLDQYSWHGKHHVAQINAFRARMKW